MTHSGEHEPIRSEKPKWMREKKRKVKEVKPAPEPFRRMRERREAARKRRMNQDG